MPKMVYTLSQHQRDAALIRLALEQAQHREDLAHVPPMVEPWVEGLLFGIFLHMTPDQQHQLEDTVLETINVPEQFRCSSLSTPESFDRMLSRFRKGPSKPENVTETTTAIVMVDPTMPPPVNQDPADRRQTNMFGPGHRVREQQPVPSVEDRAERNEPVRRFNDRASRQERTQDRPEPSRRS